jgi:hypothetical protein
MTEEQIAEIWTLFKEYLDKKQIELVAEKFIDLLADYGTSDLIMQDLIGIDKDLDKAINYYLEQDSDLYVEDDFDEDWDE